MDDDESARLAKRFDQRWFPHNQSALHDRLRRQGVLSEVDYETLKSVAELLSAEKNELNKLEGQHKAFEFERLIEVISQRLGNDAQRNALLVDHIRHAQERSILLFTNSVSHAAEMSARLNLAGISAAAISGETPKAARRYFLDRFQRGDIRVLCNYSVLTTGFDAPKTDMVIISPLVFSPVRYMQMVGRGLRGEKNGGTARCRIVTVLDNLGRFNATHAYHYCQRYFVAPV
jgi:superfamily II DNA or RNA helicase